jgi:hypothetical protein
MTQFNLMTMTEIRRCLFCGTEKGLKSREHIIPESLGNKTLILNKRVCNKCNNSFSEIENYFCQHHFGSLEKLNYLDKTKKGKKPSLPLIDGIATRNNEDKIIFRQSFIKSEDKFKMTFTDKVEFYYPINLLPIDTKRISQFLAKCGIEILYYKKKQFAYSNSFNNIREYAQTNTKDIFIPFLWGRNQEDLIDIQFVQIDSKKKGKFCFSRIKLPRCEYWFPLDRNDETYAFKILSYKFGLQIIDKPEMIEQKLNYNFVWQ